MGAGARGDPSGLGPGNVTSSGSCFPDSRPRAWAEVWSVSLATPSPTHSCCNHYSGDQKRVAYVRDAFVVAPGSQGPGFFPVGAGPSPPPGDQRAFPQTTLNFSHIKHREIIQSSHVQAHQTLTPLPSLELGPGTIRDPPRLKFWPRPKPRTLVWDFPIGSQHTTTQPDRPNRPGPGSF